MRNNLQVSAHTEKPKRPYQWIDIEDVVQKVFAICKNMVNKTVKSLATNIPENMPQIYTDPYSLEQILINLLVNASQAVDKEDSWIKLEVVWESGQNAHAVINISDNGCGMDNQTQLKIFDPFFTTKSPAEGTGLGLYVCHNLIADLGGRIEVESKAGEGSTFKIILPQKLLRERTSDGKPHNRDRR